MRRTIGATIGLALLLGAGGGRAQVRATAKAIETPDVTFFRMTGIDGYAMGTYWRDGTFNSTGISGADPPQSNVSSQTASNLSGEFFVMTHSYVYHPNLLLLDVGAGPVLYRQGYTVDGVDITGNRATYDLTARARFLRGKPYNGGLFYERKNDSQPVGPAQSLLTQNTRYGFDFALLAPVTPVPLRIDANRYQSQGKGTDQVINERVDEFNFRAERDFGKLGATTFHYQAVKDDSQSGSLGLPIQNTLSKTQRADLDSRLNLGAKNEYTLTNTVSWHALGYTTNEALLADTTQFRFDLNLQGRPTEALQTRARYQFDAYEQTGQTDTQSAKLNAVAAGVTYQATPEASGSLDFAGTFNRNTTYTANQVGISGSAQFRKEFDFGTVSANYGLTYLRRDQVAVEPVGQVVGERLVLNGTNWVPLRRLQVVASTLVVSNVPRTQTFVEGLDYTLREIGLVTEIQRLIGGNILDGQEVLADYEFDTGGTYALDEFDNSLDLGWTWKNIAGVYVRFFDSKLTLLSGMPTSPLNPVQSTTYGVRADVPFALLGEEVTAGGFAEWEDRREVISPYQRRTYEAYTELSVPLISRGSLRLSAREQDTQYVYQPEQNVNQRTITARLGARFRFGLGLSIEGNRTNDTGSPQVTRQYTSGIAKALWRVRRVLLTLDLSRTQESQGMTVTKRTNGELKLRRDF